MLSLRILAVTVLVASVTIGSLQAHANEPAAAGKELVEYRLVKWRTTHDDSTGKIAATLKKLRCEVKIESHGGHSDVNYRCPKWQQLALKNHQEAHQWETWLKKLGFETKHAH